LGSAAALHQAEDFLPATGGARLAPVELAEERRVVGKASALAFLE
jgi:hypothetical protein